MLIRCDADYYLERHFANYEGYVEAHQTKQQCMVRRGLGLVHKTTQIGRMKTCVSRRPDLGLGQAVQFVLGVTEVT